MADDTTCEPQRLGATLRGATERNLETLGFRGCRVTPTNLNIDHADPKRLGPFCRLAVDDTAPPLPGVYVWAKNGEGMYVGKSNQLRQVVHGAQMQRAYNDYTYVPASKVRQASSPRVRVNGLLNRALCEGSTIRWWWIETASADAASRLESLLIAEWDPPWNRARPMVM